MRTLVATEDAALARDTDSKALLNTDTSARDRARRARQQATEAATVKRQLSELMEQIKVINVMRAELAELRAVVEEMRACR